MHGARGAGHMSDNDTHVQLSHAEMRHIVKQVLEDMEIKNVERGVMDQLVVLGKAYEGEIMANKPPLHRRLIMFVVDSWRVVMDNRYNPLKYIPDPSLRHTLQWFYL